MAELGIIEAKVLIQLNDGETHEVGTLRIPLHAGSPKQVGHSLHIDINTDLEGRPLETEAKIRQLMSFALAAT